MAKMSREERNARYSKDLREQARERLLGMFEDGYGTSKKQTRQHDKEQDTDISANRIYSGSTYRTYYKHARYFVEWVKTEHPECRKLKQARRYINEWLQSRVDQGLSAWTIHTEAAAMNKLYGIKRDDPNRFQPPKRQRVDIKRSRGDKVSDEKYFNKAANQELIRFCQGTGLRRGILERLKGKDLYTKQQIRDRLKAAKADGDTSMLRACRDALDTFPDKRWFILSYRDKGGKSRFSPITGPYTRDIVQRMKQTAPEALVWSYVNSNADIHSYRSDYAVRIYKEHARSISLLHFKTKVLCAGGKRRSEIYVCRGDESRKKLDRRAVHMVSVALGHSREDTAITSYLRNL